MHTILNIEEIAKVVIAISQCARKHQVIAFSAPTAYFIGVVVYVNIDMYYRIFLLFKRLIDR